MPVRKKSLSLLMATTTGALFASVVTAQQAHATDLIFGSNPYNANTSTMTITGLGVNVHGTSVGGVAVFKFHTITIPNGATITATGSRPFELVATGALVLGGVIEANGVSATEFTAGPNAGGAGGGAGGVDTSSNGKGPGGGKHASSGDNGGGGGGFGGVGARGGVETVGTGGAGGAAYGDLNVRLQGGSGGSGATRIDSGLKVGGGGGGGAIGLFGASVTMQPTSVIVSAGGDGASGGCGASGGGSGGGLIIHGNSVVLDGTIVAAGGSGGKGGACGDGGGGAGGRVAVQYKNFVSHATLVTVLNGGASGNASSVCCTGGTHPSPNATGGNGRLTFAQIDASKLTIGANKSIIKGHTTTVATKLTDAGTGLAIGGRTVTLWKKPKAGGSWTKIATKTTGSGGATSVTVKPGSSTIYQWRFAGTLIHLKASSPTQTITVH